MSKQTSNARQRIQAARTSLILDQPFFGALALRLAIVEDPGCGTAWTDGKSMGYDPAFIAELTNDEVTGLIAHEVMHCACGHPWRRDQREHRQFNVACDYAINYVLEEAGLRLPKDRLRDAQYDGKSAEWIYPRLPKQQQQQPQGGGSGQPQQGQGKPQPGNGPGAGQPQQQQPRPGAGACDVRDAQAADKAEGTSEGEWQQAVQQAAAAAKARGQLPASLARLAQSAAKPKVDWRSVLHRFVQQAAKEDYTWRRPNVRFVPSGLYLPALHSESVGPVAVAIDTSGSIDDVLLKQFQAELRSVADDVRPARVHVIWCDAKVHRVDTFERDDVIEFKPVGGGGTDFRPVFAHIDAMDEPPMCVVYLTDLYGTFPQQAPALPVLWATAGQSRVEAPFGETVVIE